MGKLLNTEQAIWDSLYEQSILNQDPADAKAYADEVMRYYRLGKQAERDEQRADKEATVAKLVAWIMIPLIVLVLAGSIAYGIWWMEANDYAGLDRKEVPSAANTAIQGWYGQNDLPSKLVYVGTEKGNYLGRRAWAASFRSGEGPVCAYVWSSNSNTDEQEWAVKEQAC